MGGIGSGGYRWGRRRITVEACRVLDVNHLAQKGLFSMHRELALSWSHTATGVAAFRPDLQEVLVVFQEARGPISQAIGIFSTRCHLGGQRYYFRCPGCGARASRLYQPQEAAGPRPDASGLFACRRCWDLVYESRNIRSQFRVAIWKVGRVERKLGRRPSAFAELPPKPPRMRWRTYDGLAERYWTERKRASELLLIDYLKHFRKKLPDLVRADGGPFESGSVR